MANLMDTAATPEAPENLIVDVKDHDIEVPEDLGASGPFWKQKDVRVWLYVLGAAILIFVVVFALLSRQTSLFQGYTRITSTPDTTVDEPFEDFNASAAGEELVGEGDFADTPEDESTVDINEFLDGVIVDEGSDLSDDAPILEDEFVDDVVVVDEAPVVVVDDVFAPSDSFEDLFGPEDSFPAASEIVVSQGDDFSGPSLDSNTDAGVLESPDLQGDTGPGVFVALIPSALYALARRRRS